MIESVQTLIQALVPATTGFIVGILITPIVAHYLYHYQAWKKKAGKQSLDGTNAQVFNTLHREHEVRAPRMGGIVVWGSILITATLYSLIGRVVPMVEPFDFLSRSQTWVPIAALLVGAIVGLIDDMLVIRPSGEGLRLRMRLLIVITLGTTIGIWFYAKLGVTAVNLPFHAPLEIGWLVVPLFILLSLFLYASGVIDGIDGLSGGVFSSVFASYAMIAYAQGQTDLAALCAVTVGGLLAFLWFNVPPARFYMTDTGTMALTLMLAVVIFMTDRLGGGIGIAAFPIIGLLLVATVASDVLQITWKRVWGRKLFRVAPLHHHFEALGWSGPKVVMRYWILSIMCAFAGVIFALAALPVAV